MSPLAYKKKIYELKNSLKWILNYYNISLSNQSMYVENVEYFFQKVGKIAYVQSNSISVKS